MAPIDNKEFVIVYSETYQKLYNVTARSADNAKEKLYENIRTGIENGPEECVDSSMAVLSPFYFTFGSDKGFPYQNGYVLVYAQSLTGAIKRFRDRFPDRHKNCLNCSFWYTEERWKQTEMSRSDRFPCYETLYACENSGSVCEKSLREFYVDTPMGKLKVYAKTPVDNPDDFPGVFIDLISGNELIQLACVEYESVDKKLQTCVYGDGSDDAPTDVIMHKKN